MIKAKIVGAGGYGGVGITELLLRHPHAQIACLVDTENVGTPMSGIYPHLAGFCDEKIITPDDPKALAPADVVFFSTPDGVGVLIVSPLTACVGCGTMRQKLTFSPAAKPLQADTHVSYAYAF